MTDNVGVSGEIHTQEVMVVITKSKWHYCQIYTIDKCIHTYTL